MKAKKQWITLYGFAGAVLFLIINILGVKQASAQVDHFYGLNNSGFRIGIGGGVGTLITHYNSNPPSPVGIGSLDYDFSPYLSIGLEAQGGVLKGVDNLHHLYYKTSTDNYLDANINFRVAVGFFDNFYASNAFQDAVKRIYLGAGFGRIRTSNKFTYNDDLASYGPESTVAKVQATAFPFNVGTNIDLPGVLGLDRLSLNPNFQFTYVDSYYLDGYRTSVEHSHLKGFYNLTSIKLKYKF
jgi:hypothetical protein